MVWQQLAGLVYVGDKWKENVPFELL